MMGLELKTIEPMAINGTPGRSTDRKRSAAKGVVEWLLAASYRELRQGSF